MSMRVFFLKDHEEYKKNTLHTVPRAMGAILAMKEIAVTLTEYHKIIHKEEQELAEKEAAERELEALNEKKAKEAARLKEEADKIEAAAIKKVEEAAAAKKKKEESIISKKPAYRRKAVKR